MRPLSSSSLSSISTFLHLSHYPSQLCYDDVIGCGEVKKCLKRILSFSSPSMRNRVKRFGLKSPGGALLYGPPGRLIWCCCYIDLTAIDIVQSWDGRRISLSLSPCCWLIDVMLALLSPILFCSILFSSVLLCSVLTHVEWHTPAWHGIVWYDTTQHDMPLHETLWLTAPYNSSHSQATQRHASFSRLRLITAYPSYPSPAQTSTPLT